MHIISKFHDYYDSAMGMGVDKSLVYKRVAEPGNLLLGAPRWSYDLREETHTVGFSPSDRVTIRSWVVPLIFCGKFYRRGIAEVTYRNPKLAPGTYLPATVTDRYTADSRKAVMMRVYTDHRLSEKSEQKARYSRWHSPRDESITFKEFATTRDWILDHIREGCPVFSIRGLTQEESYERRRRWNDGLVLRLERNPSLKELGFFQVKTPFEAYQDISMFLGGVMGTDARPMVKLTDADVHAKHGYDKWSFRKMPERD